MGVRLTWKTPKRIYPYWDWVGTYYIVLLANSLPLDTSLPTKTVENEPSPIILPNTKSLGLFLAGLVVETLRPSDDTFAFRIGELGDSINNEASLRVAAQDETEQWAADVAAIQAFTG